MKLDQAKAALEASSGKRRVRVAQAEAAADRLRDKLRKARARHLGGGGCRKT